MQDCFLSSVCYDPVSGSSRKIPVCASTIACSKKILTSKLNFCLEDCNMGIPRSARTFRFHGVIGKKLITAKKPTANVSALNWYRFQCK